MNEIKLIYTSATGAAIIRWMPHDSAAVENAMRRLAARHLTARLTCDGELIGEVCKSGDRWLWSFDPAFLPVAQEGM